jgi:6-phosphogluconolactonase/glucosamine-6-phosphate isomerase/deaminase
MVKDCLSCIFLTTAFVINLTILVLSHSSCCQLFAFCIYSIVEVRNGLDFVKVNSPQAVAEHISNEISKRLSSGQKVLWLLSGGSSIKIAVAAANLLRSKVNLKNLTVTLDDERYGPPGHKDSNWRQIQDAGFSLPGAKLRLVLSGKGFAETADDYSRTLDADLDAANYAIAIAGIGADGHIFGIKPHSPAVDSQQPVVAYEWEDYQRITPTFKTIRRINEIVSYVVGEEKWLQIEKLEQDLAVAEQPAQFLKQCNKVTIYNDLKGERI